MVLRRGEVYWVNFDPSVGGEIRKIRPAVIVSNNAANASLNRVLVVPLTSQTGRLYPGEVLVQFQSKTSKAMTDQLSTASKLRFKAQCAVMSAEDMRSIEQALLLQLGLASRGTHL